MAILEVNSRRINFPENTFLNAKSVIPKLKKNFPLTEFEINEFLINGKKVDINSDHPSLIRPIGKDDIIKIQITHNISPLNHLIFDVSELLNKLLLKINSTSDELKVHGFEQIESSLAKIIEGVDTFIQGISYILTQELKEKIEIEELPIKDLQIHLLSIIKGISTARKNADYIMLTDLLEYELKDNLTQWKILILPILKKQILP